MSNWKYLIARRLTQVTLLLLFWAGSTLGLNVLVGNYSASRVLDILPMADPYAVLQMLIAGSPLAAEVLLGAAITLAFYALVAGRLFCSWVCPVNPVTDTANWLRRKLGFDDYGKRLALPRATRYAIFALALMLCFAFGLAAFEIISPIGMLHRGLIYGMGFGWAAIAVIFLFDLFVARQGFCGHLCPLGAFYSLAGRWSLLRIHHDAEACTSCMRCVALCPEQQVLPMVGKQTATVDYSECTRCGRCIDACDDGAMRFALKKTPNPDSR